MKTPNDIRDYAILIEQNRFVTDQSAKIANFLREIAAQVQYMEDALVRIRDLSNIVFPKS